MTPVASPLTIGVVFATVSRSCAKPASYCTVTSADAATLPLSKAPVWQPTPLWLIVAVPDVIWAGIGKRTKNGTTSWRTTMEVVGDGGLGGLRSPQRAACRP